MLGSTNHQKKWKHHHTFPAQTGLVQLAVAGVVLLAGRAGLSTPHTRVLVQSAPEPALETRRGSSA